MSAFEDFLSSIKPNEDYGFFGPDSVTWKVFSYPTSFMVGFQRTVVTEMFEPYLLASVSDTQAVLNRPSVRYDRTMHYVSTVAFADSQTIVKASNILFKIHSKIIGKEPLSGNYYDANDPEAQLWIHLTQWHSVLKTYEIFGPGKLSEEEENQYWKECRIAAAFQSIDPESVPKNREEMKAYYERMKPHLAATVITQETVDHLLDAADFLLEGFPAAKGPARAIIKSAFRKATIATLPQWMRKLAGVQQSKLTDTLIIQMMRANFSLMAKAPLKSQLWVLFNVSPNAAKAVAPGLLNIEPLNKKVVNSKDAWKAAQLDAPLVQYKKDISSRPEVLQEKAAVDSGPENLVKFA
jgi:uncharacterized protein (DUF2236 family)